MRTPKSPPPANPPAKPPAAPPPVPGGRVPRRRVRRSDGEKSHREILRAAADLASVDGLEGLTIASLAERVGLSKSGLFAHFRSKEELQLETIGMASEIFHEEVLRPALAEPEGVRRLRTLVGGFLDHVRRGTFPGGCFFASVSAEVDGHPGTLRDRIAAIHRAWTAQFEESVAAAQARGELSRGAEPAQVAFEVLSMLAGAHGSFLLHRDPATFDRARRGVEFLLASYGTRRSKSSD